MDDDIIGFVITTKFNGREYTVEYKPCDCSLSSNPHYHVNDTTIILWDKFVEGMTKYGNPDNSSWLSSIIKESQ